MLSPVLVVFLLGLITALATGLGAIPFAFVKTISDRAIAQAHSVASGLMLGASFGLIVEGSGIGATETIIGAGFGVLFVFLADRFFQQSEAGGSFLWHSGAREILLVLLVMTVHSFSEGVAVGVSMGGGQKLATLITVAIAIHNIPEGLAISAVMRPKGSSLISCAGWSIFSSLPQPLMAVPAFLFVESFGAVLPYGLGFAAGAMVFMVFLSLLPEAYAKAGRSRVGLIISVTMATMILFQRLL